MTLLLEFKQLEAGKHFQPGLHDNAVRAHLNATYSTKEPVSARAARYMRDNPDIYKLFCRFTWELIGAGRTHVGAKAIAERIRYESLLSGNDGYTCNNSYVAFMARRFMQENPQHDGIFETRERK